MADAVTVTARNQIADSHDGAGNTRLAPSKSLQGFPTIDDTIDSGEASYVYFHIDPKHTNYVNRILEGYEYVGVMTTVDHTGRCMVRCTPDTRKLAMDILSTLPEVSLDYKY